MTSTNFPRQGGSGLFLSVKLNNVKLNNTRGNILNQRDFVSLLISLGISFQISLQISLWISLKSARFNLKSNKIHHWISGRFHLKSFQSLFATGWVLGWSDYRVFFKWNTKSTCTSMYIYTHTCTSVLTCMHMYKFIFRTYLVGPLPALYK